MLAHDRFFLLVQLLLSANAYISDGNDFGWRMPCVKFPEFSRIDPIVSPDEPSNHAHAFHGSSRFHASADYDDLRASNCSSCRAAEDKSSYWVPPLYFRDLNGNYTAVADKGGILVYYLRRDDEYQAFPAGFRMIAGDNNRNTSTVPFLDPWNTSFWGPEEESEGMARQRALGFNCLHYGNNEQFLYRHGMPGKEFLKTCTDGLRVELAFPSCWNGKDLDSPDHKSHVAYEPFVWKGSACPSGFPVRLPQLLYEIIYDIAPLVNEPGEFVFSNGDTTGFASHGDFMNGWDPTFLKQAMDECKNDIGDIDTLPCNLLTLQSMDGCQAEDYEPLPAVAREACNGPISELCGSQNWDKAPTDDEPLPGPLPAPFIVGPVAGSVEPGSTTPESTTPQAPPSPHITTVPPEISTATVIVEITITEDVWTTVFEKRKRHAHHYHQH